jgi:3-isopropylmalate/(R)-2-methylmalate dehydratase small subunit
MEILLEGRARVFGDDINTDYIISSTRKRESLDPQVLKQYLFETVDPDFAASVLPGDMLVAGKNFGCGSAMEVAATVVVGAGIRVVIAKTFARTYFRNAINNGLIPVECDTSSIQQNDQLSVSIANASVEITNITRGESISGDPLPEIMLSILGAGGLVPYMRQKGEFVV